MKKHLTLIALLLFSNTQQTMSQTGSQRIVLAEDFSSIFCPPSAPANVYFNSLIDINTSKVVKLTYQWHMLSTFDPMYQQCSQQLDARSSYYIVTSIPYTRMNGTIGLSPYNWTQAKIDSAYAVPAPFDIALTHSFNTAYDSIFITATITCTQNIVMTTPKFRCAMTEEHIHFVSPPGNNGETDFYDIMRKMYPDASGTSLTASWTAGQTQSITFAEKIPAYIYDSSQIAVVAFIQDDFTRNVEQAVYSAPLSSTGINETTQENNLLVYPNPSSGILHIISEKESYVNIYSIDGSLQKQFNVIAGFNTISLSSLTSGIYFYQIQNENKVTRSEKLIVR